MRNLKASILCSPSPLAWFYINYEEFKAVHFRSYPIKALSFILTMRNLKDYVTLRGVGDREVLY